MTPPQPRVRKVAPVCRTCGESKNLIRGDGPPVCRSCVHMAVRLAGVSRHEP